MMSAVQTRLLSATGLALSLALAVGCDGGEGIDSGGVGGGPLPEGNTGVSQAGAQDFGLFRQILEDGGVPAPETLDAMGFFAEHKLAFPDATCGDAVCLHGALGMGRELGTGERSTLLLLGMTSPIDVDVAARPPLDLALALDLSGSMAGEPVEYLRRGLLAMLDALEPGDRLTLVTYSDAAEVRFENEDPVVERERIEGIFESLAVNGATNIYDGLFSALTAVHASQEPGRQARVILLSDGEANRGILEPARFASLAESYAAEGIGITSVGVGRGFDVSLMRALSDVGAGNFYFLEDVRAVEEVFREEVQTFLVPLALDVGISVTVEGDFRLRRAYGTRGYDGAARGATIEIPALFLAGREDPEAPVETGRRGGGGGIFIEVVDEGLRQDPPNVASLSFNYRDPLTGERHGQTLSVGNPLADGRPFPGEEGYFEDATVEKAFVVLGLFKGFERATQHAAHGEIGSARETLQAVRAAVAGWLLTHEDADIEDDLVYVDLFLANLPEETPPAPLPL